MLELGLKTLLAYLFGSLMGAMLMGTLRDVDIRQLGSGNAGGTNALRTQGFAFALGVVVIDVGKALVAVGLLPDWHIPGVGIDPTVGRDWLAVACAASAVAGHVWPLYHEFRGGKGAATLVGAVAVLAPLALLPIVLAWLAVVVTSGYVGLATIVAGLALPVAVAVIDPPAAPALITFALVMAGFILFTHRSNIARMRAGSENRVKRLWLLRPRTHRQ